MLSKNFRQILTKEEKDILYEENTKKEVNNINFLLRYFKINNSFSAQRFNIREFLKTKLPPTAIKFFDSPTTCVILVYSLFLYYVV